mgnify:CR=1 FL=1
MFKKNNVSIVAGLFLLAFAIYLAIPYQPPLDPIDELVIYFITPDVSRELTGIEKKQMYEILSRTKYRKFSLAVFPNPFYHDDYYVIAVCGNRSYHRIDFFPHGDSLNGLQPYGFIERFWGPSYFFKCKQLIVNFDEFIGKLRTHGFIK